MRGLFLMNQEGESQVGAFRQWARERGRKTGDFVARYLTRMNQGRAVGLLGGDFWSLNKIHSYKNRLTIGKKGI